MGLSSVAGSLGDGGFKAATHSVTEGGETRHIQRLALADPTGNDLGGSVGDAAYSGTGNGTLFSVLKWIGASLASLLTAVQSSTPSGVYLATDKLSNNGTLLTPKFATISASSSGNNTVVAAVTGKKIRVLAYNLIGNGAVNAKFKTAAAGADLTGLKYIAAAGGGICAPFNPLGWFETVSGDLLNLNLSAAVAVGGELVYVEV
jgi:hypothetical protein